MVALGPRDIPRLSEAGLDWPVLLFAVGTTLVVGLLCALVPVFSSGRVNLNVVLRESSAGAGSSRSRPRPPHRSGNCGSRRRRSAAFHLRPAVAQPVFGGDGLAGIRSRSRPGARAPASAVGLQSRCFHSRFLQPPRVGLARPARCGVGRGGDCPPGGGDCGDGWYSIQEKPKPSRENVPLTLFNVADADVLPSHAHPAP